MADTDPIQPWDATVTAVASLLPQATFPATLEPGKKGVTQAMVVGYIKEITGRVTVALGDWIDLDETRQDAVKAAAKDLVCQGSASYAQAARFPDSNSRGNDSYAAVLWERFETGLAQLVAQVDEWLADREVTAPDADTTGIAGSFPAPYFVDDFPM